MCVKRQAAVVISAGNLQFGIGIKIRSKWFFRPQGALLGAQGLRHAQRDFFIGRQGGFGLQDKDLVFFKPGEIIFKFLVGQSAHGKRNGKRLKGRFFIVPAVHPFFPPAQGFLPLVA